MAQVVYLLCALTSLFCMGLLIRGHRRHPSRLTFWSSICFAGLALNNGLLFVDLVLVPEVDLAVLRALVGVAAVLTMVVGLIWETR